VQGVLQIGFDLARARARQTMEQVRQAMHLVQP
jgi:hypothetical protein